MPKMTKPQLQKLVALQRAESLASAAVYAACGKDNLRFSDCYALASPAVRAAYTTARDALADFEAEIVRASRGYRNSFGHFATY